LLVAAGLLASVATVSAQEAPAEVVDRARRLLDAGDFSAALPLLEVAVARYPDDVEPVRLLARTLYWMRQFERARLVYETAVARHPGDPRLRLEFGRMLMETSQPADARRVLQPLLNVPSVQADAETLLGTLAYWQGDLAAARRFFVSALRADPAQQDASRQLREIRTLTAPWIRTSVTFRHDDQPLDRLAVAAEAGWFPMPLLVVRLRTEPARYATPAARQVWTSEVEVSHFAPAVRMDTELSAGVLQRGPAHAMDWTGRAGLGWRLGAGITIRGRFERSPYLHTVASLETPVMTESASAVLQLNHPRGWLGEAALQRHGYPDGNVGRSSYAWLLAPVVWQPRLRLQAGYAGARADTREDRFLPTDGSPGEISPVGDIPLEGRYHPYYTPQDLVSHSVTVALTAGRLSGPLLRLGGSYGVRATENATTFVLTSGGVQSEVSQRAFTPWTLRASVEAPASDALSVEARGEFGRTAFYRWSTVGLHIVYRFKVAAVPGGRVH
jgi:hypothetical protein